LVNLIDVFQNLPVILAVLGFVTLARASFIYAHHPLSSVSPKKTSLPLSWYNALVLSGIRGAVPIALALTLFGTNLPMADETRATIVSITLGVALLSVTVQSLAAGRYVKRHFGAGGESTQK